MPLRTKLDKSDEMIAERRGGSGKMPDDMPLWMAKTITSIDKFSKRVGSVVCWILMPLIFELSSLNSIIDIKQISPYFTVIIAVLLVSKVPTLSLKKISVSPKTTVFILLGIGTIIISLLFYTFEALLIFGAVYLISIPFSFFTHRYKSKKEILQTSDEEHEDVL